MSKKITSRQNKKIKALRKARNNKGKLKDYLLVEGFNLADEVLRTDLEIKACFYAEDLAESKLNKYLEASTESFVLPADLFSYVAATLNPQGILLVVEKPEFGDLSTLEAKLKEQIDKASILVLESIQDPGNVGTMIRTAYALDYDACILTGSSADPFKEKALRSSTGAALHLPTYQVESSETVLKWLKYNKIVILSMAMQGDNIKEYNLQGSFSLWIGNEGHGLKASTIANSDKVLSIPMPGGAESLNAAIAAAIAMYELKR